MIVCCTAESTDIFLLGANICLVKRGISWHEDYWQTYAVQHKNVIFGSSALLAVYQKE